MTRISTGLIFVAAVFPTLLSVGTASAADVYDCVFEQKSANMGWAPDSATIAHTSGAATATLSDPYILDTLGAPIEVDVDAETDARFTLKYELKLQAEDNEILRVVYRVTVFKADLRATITGRPLAGDNSFAADGSCVKKR